MRKTEEARLFLGEADPFTLLNSRSHMFKGVIAVHPENVIRPAGDMKLFLRIRFRAEGDIGYTMRTFAAFGRNVLVIFAMNGENLLTVRRRTTGNLRHERSCQRNGFLIEVGLTHQGLGHDCTVRMTGSEYVSRINIVLLFQILDRSGDVADIIDLVAIRFTATSSAGIPGAKLVGQNIRNLQTFDPIEKNSRGSRRLHT